MNKWHDIDSSVAKSIKYFNNNMSIKFKNGKEYMYLNVPQSIFNEILKANSFGKVFNTNIKNFYSYIEIEND